MFFSPMFIFHKQHLLLTLNSPRTSSYSEEFQEIQEWFFRGFIHSLGKIVLFTDFTRWDKAYAEIYFLWELGKTIISEYTDSTGKY